ncbi:hypothetical protein J3B02_001903 [Coemansia erecta]|nr:hypothetical protein J3B02_001903 [Coemansia erecta]
MNSNNNNIKKQARHAPSLGPPLKKPRKSKGPFAAPRKGIRKSLRLRLKSNENSIPTIAASTLSTKRNIKERSLTTLVTANSADSAAIPGLQEQEQEQEQDLSMARPVLRKSRLSNMFLGLSMGSEQEQDPVQDRANTSTSSNVSGYPDPKNAFESADALAQAEDKDISDTDISISNMVIDNDDDEDEDYVYEEDSDNDEENINEEISLAQEEETVLKTQTSETTKENTFIKTDLITMAHRTMRSLVIGREADITRRILICGDTRDNRPGITRPFQPKSTRTSKRIIAWPAVDILKYKQLMESDFYPCMGIDPFDACKREYEYIELEEPGTEFAAMQIEQMFDKQQGISGGSGFIDEDVIADSSKNGGIGLLIKRDNQGDQGQKAAADKIQIITGLHLRYPKLLEPWFSQIPVSGKPRTRKSISSSSPTANHFKPLVDMTRAQVLYQVRKTQEPLDSQLPLSELASQTVAQEAVQSIMLTFDRLADAMTSGIVNNGTVMSLGSNRCGWISVLKSALIAGMPPEVVARSYHRLAKLCDVPSREIEKLLAKRLRTSKFVETRKLPEI